MTKTYTAEVRWEDGQWQATVQDVPGAHTFARSMNGLRKRLREVIVLMDGRPDADLDDEDAFTVALAVQVTVGDSVAVSDSTAATGSGQASVKVTGSGTGHRVVTGSGDATAGLSASSTFTTNRPDEALQLAAEARRRAAEAEAEAEHATTIAVLMAQQAGISVRDAAVLLGISHQRVQQILAEASRELTSQGS